MVTQLTVQFLSLLRSLGGAILSSVGPVGVIALLAGGFLLLQVPASFLRFVVRPRNLALVTALLVGGIGIMLNGSPPFVGQAAPVPPAKPADPQTTPADAQVLPDTLVTFEPPAAAEVKQPNATCGNCGTDFLASWNKKTRCPQCGFVMDSERAMREKSGPVGPDLTSDWFFKSLEHDRKMAELERQMRERDRPRREAKEAREREINRWKAYFLDHAVFKSFEHNGYCIHCRNEFKTPNEGRKLFMPCPRCSKEAVTWRAVEKPEGHMHGWSFDSDYKSLNTP